MNQDLMPVLIGVGQFTDRSSSANGLTPVEMMAEAARIAIYDSGTRSLLDNVDCLAAVGLTVDAKQVSTPVSGMYKNVPKTVAKQLGINANRLIYTETGGNTPQRLVNYFAQQISEGQVGTVLLTGGEALNTMAKRFNHWSKILLPKGAWRDNPGGMPETFGDAQAGSSAMEDRYAMNLPANVYPLFENALCAHYGHEPQQHRQIMGNMFSSFSSVAQANPHAWFKQQRNAEQLITPSDENRMVAYPYTKMLNSMISVNQSAAVIMTSVTNAKALGVSRDKWVFLHGCGDANEIWNVSHRDNYHSSPAMGAAAKAALSMAGKSIDEIAFFDIYSCFPSAVQIACDEFGIAHNDSRGLTLTGGLPYFGGPGNNYSMHGIVEVVNRARAYPSEYGLLNANGWYLTKHSVGVYGCQVPVDRVFSSSMAEPQQPSVECVEQANGRATIETYTVLFDKHNQPTKSLVIGRLVNGKRFIATTLKSPDIFHDLTNRQCVGRQGSVQYRGGKNIFSFV